MKPKILSRMPRLRRIPPLACLGLLLLLSAPTARSYSVLTHEAMVDSVWDSSIRVLLLQRFPNATADELTAAHAYAYGGSALLSFGPLSFHLQLFSRLSALV